MLRAVLTVSIVAALGILQACIPITDNDVCADADDCASDEVCTDVRECAATNDATAWRIGWTINGAAASESSCVLVTNIIVTISSTEEQLTYTPISCESGSFGFRSLPVRYNRAKVEAVGESGTLDQASMSGNREPGAELILDLAF